jgi:hypothetical protein
MKPGSSVYITDRKILADKKSQSALEYMMTYGWAILIIVIVAAVLYSLGIFNPTSFVATESVSGFAGLGSIQAQCSAGGLEMSIGNAVGSLINITDVNVTLNGQTYINQIFPDYSSYPSAYLISPDQESSFILRNACPNSTGRFSETVTLAYKEPGQVFPGPYQSTGTISGNSVSQYGSQDLIIVPDYLGTDTTEWALIWNTCSNPNVFLTEGSATNGFLGQHTEDFTIGNEAGCTYDRAWSVNGAQTTQFQVGKTYLISFYYRANTTVSVRDRDTQIVDIPANTGSAKYIQIQYTPTSSDIPSSQADLMFAFDSQPSYFQMNQLQILTSG